MATRRVPTIDEATAAPIRAVVWWLAITVCATLIGLLFSHPWAGLFVGLTFGYFAPDYVERKSLWTLVGFAIWIAGVALHHPWIGFAVGFAVTVGICSIVYQ